MNTSQKIMIVDDDRNVLAGLKMHLCRDFEVTVTTEASQALAALQQDPSYAVLLSDLRMPGIDGIELLKAANTISPHTTRLLLTGFANLNSALDAVNEGGVFRILTKPCPPPALRDAVYDAVRQHRLMLKAQVEEDSYLEKSSLRRTAELASIGKAAAAVGHELATVTSVYASVVYMIRRALDKGSEIANDDLEDLDWVESHLRVFADELLALGSEKTLVCDQKVEVNLQELVNARLRELEIVGHLKHIDVIRVFSQIPSVVASPSSLSVALTHVLINAAEALEGVETPKIQLSTALDSLHDEIVFRVADNGAGIPVECGDEVFAPFFTTRPNSTGLGLYVTRMLVEEMGGKIRHFRASGLTVFEIRLPIREHGELALAETSVSLERRETYVHKKSGEFQRVLIPTKKY